MSHALTLITFVPIAGMVLILALPDSMKQAFEVDRGGGDDTATADSHLPLRKLRHDDQRGAVRRESVVDARVPH